MQFHSHPEYIPIRAYQQNVEAYAAYLKGRKDVAGLFSMGSVSAPGISDIDLIVVVRNNIPHRLSLSPFDLNLDRRLFVHDVFALNVKLANQFNYIFYPTNIKPIFKKNGVRISFPSLHGMSKELQLMYLIELSKMRVDQLCAISRSGKCNIRKLITRVSSIIHSLNIAGELSIKMPNSVYAYRDSIVSLRNNWTKNKGASIQHIDKIFENGFHSWCRILEAASNELGRFNGIVRCEKSFNRKFMNIRFSNQNSCGLIEDRHGRCRQVLLPKNLHYHFEGYKRPGTNKYRREQIKRLHLIKEHRQFLKKSGMTFSMSGNPGFPVNTMDKVTLLIRGIKNYIPNLTR